MSRATRSTSEKVDAHFSPSFAIFTKTRDFSPLTTTRTWIFYWNQSLEVQKWGWHLVKLTKIQLEVAGEADRHLLLSAEHLLPADARRTNPRKFYINFTHENSQITRIRQVFHDPNIVFPSFGEFGGGFACLFVYFLTAEKGPVANAEIWQVATSLKTSSPKHSILGLQSPFLVKTHIYNDEG